MNYRKAFGFQSFFGEVDEDPRVPPVRAHPVLCVSELGLKSPPHPEAHVLAHHAHFSGHEAQPRTFLALNAHTIDVNVKWLFPTVGLSCMHVRFVTLPGTSYIVLKGKKLETEVYTGPKFGVYGIPPIIIISESQRLNHA